MVPLLVQKLPSQHWSGIISTDLTTAMALEGRRIIRHRMLVFWHHRAMVDKLMRRRMAEATQGGWHDGSATVKSSLVDALPDFPLSVGLSSNRRERAYKKPTGGQGIRHNPTTSRNKIGLMTKTWRYPMSIELSSVGE